jgi:glycosyltransferase domain-containing protein
MNIYPSLEKLTIVIPTYNKHIELIYVINFWIKYNVKLLILDGSDSKLKYDFSKTQNINYIHSAENFYSRLLSSTKYIKTEFVLLSCDDEFYLPSALSSCVDFLIKNSTYSSCGGCSIGFIKESSEKIYGLESPPNLKGRHLNDDCPINRAKSHFSKYAMSHLWSVTRFNKWEIICNCVFKEEYNFYAAFELQIELLTVISGKTKTLSELLWLRNLGTPPFRESSKASLSWSESLRIEDWWKDKNFSNEVSSLLINTSNASKLLNPTFKNKFTETEISNIFKLYIYGYNLNRGIIDKYLFSMIRKMLPRKVIAYLKRFFRYDKFINNKQTLKKKSIIDQAKTIEKKGIMVNYKDLSSIKF